MTSKDKSDKFATLRAQFQFPTNSSVGAIERDADGVHPGEPSAYLCGNSLGLLPKKAAALVHEELVVWGSCAVQGHFTHPHGREWMNIVDHVHPLLANIVGARANEVACMGTLTGNLHLMMNTFYKPTTERYKILCEAHAFPSDQYAFASQARQHGFDPGDAVIELAPRDGEFTLREDDILAAIDANASQIAVVLFSGVQYYTGQCFPMEAISLRARNAGCIVGFDLAHAAGNVPLALHDWGVDFAVWCSYKYLNAGPGAIAGLFVHERWDSREPSHAGWWGHDPKTRFQMPNKFAPIPGAQGFQQSNPSVLSVAALLGSLQTFAEAGMLQVLRPRSMALTGSLHDQLISSRFYRPQNKAASATDGFTIITPTEPIARGAQLSLLFFGGTMERVFAGLLLRGVVGDERRPDVIRLAPAPLYNSEADVHRAAAAVIEVLEEIAGS